MIRDMRNHPPVVGNHHEPVPVERLVRRTIIEEYESACGGIRYEGRMRLRQVLSRAVHDTLRVAVSGDPGRIARHAYGFVLGLAVHWRFFGLEAMLSELAVALTFGLGGVGALTLLSFAYNLVLTPYRIEKERAEALEANFADYRKGHQASWSALTGEYKIGKETLTGKWFGREFVLDSPIHDCSFTDGNMIWRRLTLSAPANHLVRLQYDVFGPEGTTLLLRQCGSPQVYGLHGRGSVSIAVDSTGSIERAIRKTSDEIAGAVIHTAAWVEPGRPA